MRPGDTVTLIRYYYGDPSKVEQRTIARVTPTGRIVLENDDQFVMKNGEYRLRSDSYHGHSIITIDAERIEKAQRFIEHKQLISKLNNTDYRKYSIETLRGIAALLQEHDNVS